jgi:hypothetical protein
MSNTVAAAFGAPRSVADGAGRSAARRIAAGPPCATIRMNRQEMGREQKWAFGQGGLAPAAF